MDLVLMRQYHPLGTNGVLSYGEQVICYTIELPWQNNQRLVSCIPEGRYKIVERFSKRHKLHLQVLGVPNRTLILFHRANDAARQLQGCIAPVSALTAPGKGSHSARAFNKLLRLVFNIQTRENPLWLCITGQPQDSSHLKFITL